MKKTVKLGYCGTLHGYALRVLEIDGGSIGIRECVTVMDESDAAAAFESHAAALGWKGGKQELADAKAARLRSLPVDAKAMRGAQLVVESWFAGMIKTGAFDFDGLLLWGLAVLRKMAGKLAPIHLLVDEAQDAAPIDSQFYDALNRETQFVVGDPDQCQPAGTLVLTSEGWEKPIEQIKVGDQVVSYARREKVLLKSATVSSVSRRSFNGVIYTVAAGNYRTRCTGNHRWLVRWLSGSERNGVKLWATYLMRKGDHFRVGKTAFFRSGSGKGDVLGPALRLRQEGADGVWVLKIHKHHADAVAHEAITAANYGLPQECFKAVKTNTNCSQRVLDWIFASVHSQLRKAVQCLTDHGRDLAFPLFSRRDKRTRRTVQEIRACNLLEDVMHVPVAGEKYDYKTRAGNWQPVRVSMDQFSGDVYSLDVEKHHKYVADGLVTCNSIFAFRGSDPGILVDMAHRAGSGLHRLQGNHRCGAEICIVANDLIRNNKNRVHKESLCLNGLDGDFEVWTGLPTVEKELRALAEDIRLTQDKFECAVLLRTNMLVDQYRAGLESFGIPCASRREPERPRDWGLCKAALAAMANPRSDHLVLTLVEKMAGANTARQLRLDAAKAEKPVNDFRHTVPGDVGPQECADWLARFRVGIESVELVKAAMAGAKSVADGILRLAQSEHQGVIEGEGVTVCTMHSAKGREWRTVYLPAFEQAVIPGTRKGMSIEDERRLAFVAATRASHRLVISRADVRKLNKWTQNAQTEPSQFLAEMEGRQ